MSKPVFKSGKPIKPATRIPKRGWRRKKSDLEYATGLMSQRLAGMMVKDEEGLVYIIVVRKSTTFYIWRENKNLWNVSAHELDFINHAQFSRPGDITLWMYDNNTEYSFE